MLSSLVSFVNTFETCAPFQKAALAAAVWSPAASSGAAAGTSPSSTAAAHAHAAAAAAAAAAASSSPSPPAAHPPPPPSAPAGYSHGYRAVRLNFGAKGICSNLLHHYQSACKLLY